MKLMTLENQYDGADWKSINRSILNDDRSIISTKKAKSVTNTAYASQRQVLNQQSFSPQMQSFIHSKFSQKNSPLADMRSDGSVHNILQIIRKYQIHPQKFNRVRFEMFREDK